MKKIIFIIIFIVFFFIDAIHVYCIDSNYLSEKLDKLNIEQYDNIINENIIESNFKFSDIVKKVVTGNFKEIDVPSIISYLIKGIFKEIFENSKIVKNVIIISLLCAFLKVLTESFKNQGISEIGFYTGYMVIITLLISSFSLVIDVLYEAVEAISNIINGIMPILIGVLVMSGLPSTGTIFSGFILTSLSFLSFIIKNIFIPFISGLVILNVINYITPREVLNKLIDFLKLLLNFSLRGIAIILTFAISIQRISAPILNSTINKTAKTFINFVPVVGDAMNGAIDGFMYFVGILRNGIGVGILISIIFCILVPVFKLISLIFIYKITAILIEPISDKRIIASVDSLGEYTKIVLSTLILFSFLFILFVAIMLSISV